MTTTATTAEILAAIERGTAGIVHHLTATGPACGTEGPELIALDTDPAAVTCRPCFRARGRAAAAEPDGGRAPWSDPITGPAAAAAYAAGDETAAGEIMRAHSEGFDEVINAELRRLGYPTN